MNDGAKLLDSSPSGRVVRNSTLSVDNIRLNRQRRRSKDKQNPLYGDFSDSFEQYRLAKVPEQPEHAETCGACYDREYL